MADIGVMGHPGEAALRKRVKRILVIVAIAALLLAVVGITVRLVKRSHVRQRTEESAQMTVVTAEPQLSDAGDELVLPGTVMAYTESPIYARTSGYLKSWKEDIGSHVRKGQLLAEIETPEVDRQLAQGRADLAAARANARLARTTNQRWQALALKQAVSRQDAEDRAGDAAAKSATEVAAEQNVARLEDLESFKHVIAPFSGVITARNTDVGALINAGQAAGGELFRLADIHVLRIYAQVPEAYAQGVRTGTVAELHFVERPGKSYPVSAVRTSNALDPSARTLQVELDLDNQSQEFLPGGYVEIHFKLPSATQTMRLPANTILFRGDGLQVATVDAGQKVLVKNVTQGRDFGKTVEILDGLDPKDQVIVNPSDSIETGVQVRVAPPKQDDKDKQQASNAKDKKQGTGG